MAKGRIIINDITKDKKINDLSDDTSRLGFTWLVTFADVEGRTFGDPALVRSMLFPRRDDITVGQMEYYLKEWANAGLILWYEANGDMWVQFPNFDKHQKIRKDREAPSNIPEPPTAIGDTTPEQVRSNSAEMRVKLKEEKLKEEKGARYSNSPSAVASRIYTEVTGQISIPSSILDDVIADIESVLMQRDTVEETIEYLRPYYQTWITTKGKNGRLYSKTNPGWLDWAIAGEMPGEINVSGFRSANDY